MPTTTRKIRIYVAAESGGFGVDPSASGAASYVPVRVLGPPEGSLPLLVHDRPPLETNYFTGRNEPTPHEMGPDGATLTFETPLTGFATAATTGGAPPAADALDILLACAFGAANAYNGMAVSSSTSTTLTTATSTAVAQDMLCVVDAAVNSGRAQWRRTSSASSPYTVDHAWTANPTATGIAYGIKRWTFADTQGESVACYYELDGTGYPLVGGRVTALKLSMPAGKFAKLTWTLRFDTKTTATKGSIPAFAAWSGSVIHGDLAVFEWGGTGYATKQIDIDWRLESSDSATVNASNMRSNIEVTGTAPVVSVMPLYATTWEADFAAGTSRTLMIRFGAGALSGGAVNTLAFWAEGAQALAPKISDDGNRLRQSIDLACKGTGLIGGAVARFWQLARA